MMAKQDIYKDFREYCEIYISKPLKLVGFDCTVPNFCLNLISYLIMFDIFTYLFINAHSIYIFSKDLKSACFCMVTYGYAFIMIGRILIGIINNQKLVQLYDVFFAFTFNAKTDRKEIELLVWYGKTLKLLGFLGTSVIGLASVSVSIAPLIIFTITKQKQLIFGFMLPGIDAESLLGFSLNYMYQTMQGILVPIGAIGYLNLQLFFVICACFQLDLIMIKLEKLDEKLSIKDFGRKSKKQHMENIAKLHQKLDIFISCQEDIYSLESFNSVFFLTLTIVITLFVCVKEFWIVGIMISVALTYTLFILCLFGVAIEIKSDELRRSIYDIQWYCLTVQDQKLLLLLLKAAQNPILLTFGGMYPLNLESFSQVI